MEYGSQQLAVSLVKCCSGLLRAWIQQVTNSHLLHPFNTGFDWWFLKWRRGKDKRAHKIILFPNVRFESVSLNEPGSLVWHRRVSCWYSWHFCANCLRDYHKTNLLTALYFHQFGVWLPKGDSELDDKHPALKEHMGASHRSPSKRKRWYTSGWGRRCLAVCTHWIQSAAWSISVPHCWLVAEWKCMRGMKKSEIRMDLQLNLTCHTR